MDIKKIYVDDSNIILYYEDVRESQLNTFQLSSVYTFGYSKIFGISYIHKVKFIYYIDIESSTNMSIFFSNYRDQIIKMIRNKKICNILM